MQTIKLIKKAERKVLKTGSRIKSVAQQNRSPQGVRSWVTKFKKTSPGESRIAFDSLFKDALPQLGQAD